MDRVIELTRASSKGQIVLPKEIRNRLHIKKGTVFALKATDDVVLLKKIENPILKRDLEALESAELAWKEIEAGKYRKMGAADFIKELAKWGE